MLSVDAAYAFAFSLNRSYNLSKFQVWHHCKMSDTFQHQTSSGVDSWNRELEDGQGRETWERCFTVETWNTNPSTKVILCHRYTGCMMYCVVSLGQRTRTVTFSKIWFYKMIVILKNDHIRHKHRILPRSSRTWSWWSLCPQVTSRNAWGHTRCPLDHAQVSNRTTRHFPVLFPV